MTTGSHRISVRREIRSVERGLIELQREVGDTVYWYEFDPAASSAGDTYGEGSIPDPFDPTLTPSGTGVVFKAPKPTFAVWIRFIPPSNAQTDAGEYTLDHTSMRFAVKTLRETGLRHPEDPTWHFNDRIAYNGILFRIEQYEPKGWLHNAYLMIDVSARQFKDDELETDTFPLGEPVGTSMPWKPGEQLNWPALRPSDWENDDLVGAEQSGTSGGENLDGGDAGSDYYPEQVFDGGRS